jgi:hypothetical protein
MASVIGRAIGLDVHLDFCEVAVRGENYAHQQPSLTAKKLRKLELKAGAERCSKSAAGVWTTNHAMREAERKLAEQAEASYVRMVRDWQATAPKKVDASATPERA